MGVVDHDRISGMPDHILGRILCLMPVKQATCTSVLSSRWRHLWKHVWASATNLDFAGDLASRQTAEQLVACIRRYLQLHTAKKIGAFRLSLHPAEPYRRDLLNCFEFAASRSVEHLVLDFSPGPGEDRIIDGGEAAEEAQNLFSVPSALFDCGTTLTDLTLSYCSICRPQARRCPTGGVPLLKSLSLSSVDIDDDTLRGFLSSCPLLETLDLRDCCRLSSIQITAPQCARLKRLVVVNCWELRYLTVATPGVESIHFFGEVNETFSLAGASSLTDALICSINMESCEPWHDYVKLLSHLAHVRILTICPATLMRVTIWEDYYVNNEEYLPLQLGNLKELQILMCIMDAEYLRCMYGFFRLCPSPFLEKLFIRLPKLGEEPRLPSAEDQDHVVEGPESVQLDCLIYVKMTNFKGSPCEMELAKFLLEKAGNLEYLIVVTPSIHSADEARRLSAKYQISETRVAGEIDLKDVRRRLLSLPKASTGAQIVVVEQSEDDGGVVPTHSSLYREHAMDWWV